MNKYLLIGIICFISLGKIKAQFRIGTEVGIAPRMIDILRSNSDPGGCLTLEYYLRTDKRLSFSLGVYGSQSTDYILPSYTKYNRYQYLFPANISYQKIYGDAKIKRLWGYDFGVLFEKQKKNNYRYNIDPNYVDPPSQTYISMGLGVTMGFITDLTERIDLSLKSRPQIYFGNDGMFMFWINLVASYKI